MLEFHKLTASEKERYYSVQAFISSRLESYEAIDWALNIPKTEREKIAAITDLLNNPPSGNLTQPWYQTWALVKETWAREYEKGFSDFSSYLISDRILAGERSSRIIQEIVHLVSPYLKIQTINNRKKKNPKSVEDIVFSRLESDELIHPDEISLSSVEEIDFLIELASQLEKAVDNGIYTARLSGWNDNKPLYYLGSVRRVYFLEKNNEDPDEFGSGIAPCVKLLSAVTEIIANKSTRAARLIVEGWRQKNTAIYIRLWAAFSRNEHLVEPEVLADYLLSASKKQFWDVNDFPEVSEARAVRFSSFDSKSQKIIIRRILRKPPRSFWPKKSESSKVDNALVYWAVRELKRIEVADGLLNSSGSRYLIENLPKFPSLANSSVEEGFPKSSKAGWVAPTPDFKYDDLNGVDRLRSLENALKTSDQYWSRTTAGQANDWLQHETNSLKVINDFQAKLTLSNQFPNLIERLGWIHKFKEEGENSKEISKGFNLFLRILESLSPKDMKLSINGIAEWLENWKDKIAYSKRALSLWFTIWPVAVSSTNLTTSSSKPEDLSAVVMSSNDEESMDLDTLNTPAGKMVGVFLKVCPNLKDKKRPFNKRSIEYKMREAIFSANGKSLLIAQHRLISFLGYFKAADSAWAVENLVNELMTNNARSVPLWRSLSRQSLTPELMEIIGPEMIKRVHDKRLGRTPRRNFSYRLIWELLNGFREKRKSAVSVPEIQQMIRTVDDETRASCAEALKIYLRDAPEKPKSNETPEFVFENAIMPFLKQVWPQERTLVTKGVSKTFVQLPALTSSKFAEAVDVVLRFVVYFDCWSMHDFGLFPENGKRTPTLSVIRRKKDAKALLDILDQSIGHNLNAVSPHNLSDALDKIKAVDPKLEKKMEFRRLLVKVRK